MKPSPERILVINVARIGDTLFITPAIHALRETFPSASIDVMAHPKRMCVLENNPDIDRVFGYSIWRYLSARFFKRKAYDFVFLYGSEVKLLKYARMIGGYVVGFSQKDPLLNRLLDITVLPSETPLHAVDDRLQLVKAIGVVNPDRRLIYVVSEAERRWARAFMEQQGLSKGSIRIGFQVAGFPTKAFRDWPAENFVSLGRYILSELNACILLFGDKRCSKKAQYIQQALGSKKGVVMLAGKVSLRQFGALLSECDAFVTTDTGPMHLAFALEIPTVALYHCFIPAKYLSPTVNARIHRLIQMKPPLGEICGRHLKMDLIDSGRVWRALKDILMVRGLV